MLSNFSRSTVESGDLFAAQEGAGVGPCKEKPLRGVSQSAGLLAAAPQVERMLGPRRAEVTLVLLTTEEDLRNVVDREDVPEYFTKGLQRSFKFRLCSHRVYLASRDNSL